MSTSPTAGQAHVLPVTCSFPAKDAMAWVGYVVLVGLKELYCDNNGMNSIKEFNGIFTDNNHKHYGSIFAYNSSITFW